MGPNPIRAILAAVAALTLAGCDKTSSAVAGWTAAASGASLVVFDRTPVDLLVSLGKGRDCSVLNYAPHGEYCRSPDPVPGPPPFCVRTLGNVECYAYANPYGRQATIVDTPPLTPAQQRRASGAWP